MTPQEIVREALAEDARNVDGQRFDADGFSNFCPEENPATVAIAWLLYDRIVYGGEAVESVLAEERAR